MSERIVRQPPSTQAHFSQVPSAEIERSTFDRSHPWKGTIEKAGQLVPVFWDEILPGDTFNVNATVFLRLATPLKPIMDNLKAEMHYFFVPNRLVWENWTRFMGEVRRTPDGEDIDPADLTIPLAQLDLADEDNYGTVPDYLGLPIGQPSLAGVSDLPFRAYELIWYEWYRDQNIQSAATPPKIDDSTTDRNAMPLKLRNKRKDYFTACLPWPQKGDPVLIPLGESAPVIANPDGSGEPQFLIQGSTSAIGVRAGGDATAVDWISNVNNTDAIASWFDPQLIADLSNSEGTSINDLRTAFQIQRLLERDARGGTRYIELVLSHFGVQSDDARLQRPEYLGSGSAMININPIASTYAGPEVPQGNLSAIGTGLLKAGFNHSFTEHGLVMGLLSIQSDLTYQQGVERYWARRTRYDFYWPALAHLGEQAVRNQELYVQALLEDNVATFGYQERYAEYRYRPGRITGLFRSNHPESLDVWHLAQDFDSPPTLNGAFINENPPIDRIIAVPTEPHFICDAWFNMKCTRPMPVYSVPGMIDHF